MKKISVAVLVSGGGTNLQAIIDAASAGIIRSAELRVVISDREGAYALTRAQNAGIEAVALPKKRFRTHEEFEKELERQLDLRRIELIVLAGFTSILGKDFTDKYAERIINVHPSLIPSFCGKGYYGLKVHEAALARGVKVTGATVHFVNEIPDGGRIIAQKAVEVQPDDTPETLQKRVMCLAEWIILPQAVEKVAAHLLQCKTQGDK